MKNITRRDALQILGAAPVAAAMAWTPAEAEQAHHAAEQAAKSAAPFRPKFFTAHEYATVGILVDLIIPKDERSGSATDAGVPPFMDFMMVDQPARQVAMRGGLALVDRLCEDRYSKRFTALTDPQRRAILDEIAYTSRPGLGAEASAKAARNLRHHITFFNSFRDLTATGFFTTRMGIDDLQYQGNVFVTEWKGCPEAALTKLGVKYE